MCNSIKKLVRFVIFTGADLVQFFQYTHVMNSQRCSYLQCRGADTNMFSIKALFFMMFTGFPGLMD